MVSKEKQIDILSPKGEVLFRLNIIETEGNPSNQTISSNGCTEEIHFSDLWITWNERRIHSFLHEKILRSK